MFPWAGSAIACGTCPSRLDKQRTGGRSGLGSSSLSSCQAKEPTSRAARGKTTRLSDRNRLISPGKRTLPHETSQRHDHRCHPPVTGKSTHLLANACFLERSQGAQRRLLRIGETPDARDLEAL